MANETSDVSGRQAAPESPIKQILTFLGSMQLGIILLLLLALISVFATTQPMSLAIANVYTSWWFIGIMAFTALNLLICTVERIRPLSRQALQPKRERSADAISKMQLNTAVKMPDAETALAKAEKVFRKNGLKVTASKTETGTVVFGERGKYGYFGSIVTHFSLILILLGAMYGSLTGFESANGGAAGDRFFVAEGNFDATIHDVNLDWLEGPEVRPKATAELTVNYQGEVFRDTTSINQPMRFRGVTMYQSSFGWIPIIEVRDPDSGELLETLRPYFNSDTEGRFAGYGGDNRAIFHDQEVFIEFPVFLVNFTMSQMGVPITANQYPANPHIVYRVNYFDGNSEPWGVLPLNEPTIIETEKGNFEATLVGHENYIILSIAKNLGRPYLFIGSMLMILGMYMSFFLFPRRFWAAYDEKKSQLVIGGSGYRNRLGVEQALERIESEIQGREEQ